MRTLKNLFNDYNFEMYTFIKTKTTHIVCHESIFFGYALNELIKMCNRQKYNYYMTTTLEGKQEFVYYKG